MPRPRSRSSAGVRVAAVVLTALSLAAAVVLAFPQAVGLQRTLPVAQAISFRTPIAIGVSCAVLLLLIAIASSRSARRVLGGVTVVLALFVVASGVTVATRGLGSTAVPAEHSTGDVRVLTWNTRGDEPGSPTIAELALEVDADIVVLPETTEAMGVEIATIMGEAGSPMWVHTRTIDEEFKATATTLLISPELGDYVVVTDEGDTEVLPTVVAKPLGGGGPTIVAAHAVSPTPRNMGAWERDLEWLSTQCTGDVILAGDLNATVDHLAGLDRDRTAAFGSVLGECADGALETGNGAVGTWSTGLEPLLGTPIDHVMASSHWRFTGFEVITSVDLTGSDHRPVFAQVSRADAARADGAVPDPGRAPSDPPPAAAALRAANAHARGERMAR